MTKLSSRATVSLVFLSVEALSETRGDVTCLVRPKDPPTHLNRFSAPDLSISSLLISMFSFERLFWSLPRHVAARGSEPCGVLIFIAFIVALLLAKLSRNKVNDLG